MVELGFTHMTLSLDSLHHIAFYPLSLSLLGGSKKDKSQGAPAFIKLEILWRKNSKYRCFC